MKHSHENPSSRPSAGIRDRYFRGSRQPGRRVCLHQAQLRLALAGNSRKVGRLAGVLPLGTSRTTHPTSKGSSDENAPPCPSFGIRYWRRGGCNQPGRRVRLRQAELRLRLARNRPRSIWSTARGRPASFTCDPPYASERPIPLKTLVLAVLLACGIGAVAAVINPAVAYACTRPNCD